MNDIQIKYNDIVLKYSITKIHLISKKFQVFSFSSFWGKL